MPVFSRRAWRRALMFALFTCGVAAGGHVFAQALQEARLEAPSPWARQAFGRSVAVSNDTLVVGAPGTAAAFGSGAREGVGAAHIFVRDASSGAWTLDRSLLAASEALVSPNYGVIVQPGFGASVAIDGDVLVVGAPYADTAFVDTGRALVYERDANGDWQFVASLAPGILAFDELQFGRSVAISGDTIVVGAPGADSPTTAAVAAGAAWVYTRSQTGAWVLEAVLRDDVQDNDTFGYAVAIDGSTIAIGARFESSAASGVNGDESDNSAPQAGAVHVFVRGDAGWSRQAYLKASSPGSGDFFGESVAVRGDRVLVGAPLEDTAEGVNDDAGAAHVFVRDAGTGTWTPEASLKPAGSQAGSKYGTAVALDGHTAMIGGPTPDTDRSGTEGTVVWFARDLSGTWTERGQAFEVGHVVAMAGRTAVVGSPAETVNLMAGAGAVYVLTLPDMTPPEVTAPPDIELEATGTLTDVTLGAATVTDDSGEVLTATPDNAGPFPVGVTVVTWSATDSAGNTGTDTQLVTITEVVEPVDPLDLDIAAFRATGRVKAGNSQSVIFTFKVKNQGANATDSGSATLVGTLDGVEVYRHTLTGITDAPGGPGTSWDFPPHTTAPGTPTGVITWVLTIEDADPDTDTATATTRVVS